MQNGKRGFEETLQEHVVSPLRCIGCATCIIVCPFKCLELVEQHPSIVKKCENCGICPQVCPKFEWSQSEAEEFVFGRQRSEDEEFGIYRRLALAQATDKNIRERCQDGGLVTAILVNALERNQIEGAALSGLDTARPLFPVPTLATTREDVLRSSGTRYSYSPNMFALQEGVKQKKTGLAYVGTPCQIHAARRLQMFPLKKFANPLKFTIGLMCTESFTYDGFFQKHLRKNMGIDLNRVQKVNIKGKIIVSLDSGEAKSVPLSEAKQYVRGSCKLCNDFSAELADISAGGLGLDGWTFTILRTKEGEEAFDAAQQAGEVTSRAVDKNSFPMNLLHKLSKKKRRTIQPS